MGRGSVHGQPVLLETLSQKRKEMCTHLPKNYPISALYTPSSFLKWLLCLFVWCREEGCTCITAHMWRSEDNLRDQACWQMPLHSVPSCKPSLLMLSTFLKIFSLLVASYLYIHTHVMKHLSMISINL